MVKIIYNTLYISYLTRKGRYVGMKYVIPKRKFILYFDGIKIIYREALEIVTEMREEDPEYFIDRDNAFFLQVVVSECLNILLSNVQKIMEGKPIQSTKIPPDQEMNLSERFATETGNIYFLNTDFDKILIEKFHTDLEGKTRYSCCGHLLRTMAVFVSLALAALGLYLGIIYRDSEWFGGLPLILFSICLPMPIAICSSHKTYSCVYTRRTN